MYGNQHIESKLIEIATQISRSQAQVLTARPNRVRDAPRRVKHIDAHFLNHLSIPFYLCFNVSMVAECLSCI